MESSSVVEKIDFLEKIGLTNAESKIYLSLLKLGESKVGAIIKLSKVSSSKVHDALNKLIDKGIVSYILKNNIKYFTASNPKSLKVILEDKKRNIEEQEVELNSILSELNNLSKKEQVLTGAEIFIGFKGVKSAFEKLYQEKIEQEESLFFNKMTKENVEIINRFFKQLEASNKFRDINHKGICSMLYKKYFIPKKNKNVQIKYTNKSILSSTNIYGDKMLLVAWSKNPIAFFITSRDVVDTFRDLFYGMWNEL